MSCALTQSVLLGCREGQGGIEEIKIKVKPSASNLALGYTVTSGVVTMAGTGLTGWYTWQLPKETGSFTETIVGSVQNGTLSFAQAVKIIGNQLRASVRNEIMLVAKNSVQIAVKSNDGSYWLAGYQRGLDLLAGTAGTGTGYNDRNGYDLDFTGTEKLSMLNMSSATYDSLVTV